MEHLLSTAGESPATVRGPRLASDVALMAREGAGVLRDYSPTSLALRYQLAVLRQPVKSKLTWPDRAPPLLHRLPPPRHASFKSR